MWWNSPQAATCIKRSQRLLAANSENFVNAGRFIDLMQMRERHLDSSERVGRSCIAPVWTKWGCTQGSMNYES